MYLTMKAGASAPLLLALALLAGGCKLDDISTLGVEGGVAAAREDAGTRGDGVADVSAGDAASPVSDLRPGDGMTVQATKTPGEACGSAGECRSGFCVDGVCCETACAGICESCDRSDRRGTCGPISGRPRGLREPCVGQGAGTCGGSCDGVDGSHCKYPGSDVECATAVCASGMALTRRVCSGAGVCLPPANISCAPYACDGPICAGGCGPGRPCAAGSYCTGGRCLPLLPLGGACTEAGQCASGNCAQGRCCNSACTGACQSCALPASLGTCGTPVFATDPANCGSCGNRCSSNHVTPACTAGKCSGACAAGFADCNGNKDGDGCETSLATGANCGGCGVRCPGTACLAGGQCEKIAFQWSFAGPLVGKHCILIAEAADPHAWGDNYLCTQRDFGLVWSAAGPVANSTCVQWLEPSDPNTWTDNFLCSAQDYGLRWSFAGAIAGMNCTKIEEPAEPPLETWTDNYLCAPP